MNTVYKIHKTAQSQSKNVLNTAISTSHAFKEHRQQARTYKFTNSVTPGDSYLTKILKRSWFDVSAVYFNESDFKETVPGKRNLKFQFRVVVDNINNQKSWQI